MFKIDIYTDGSCINNPGPGGCAALLKINNFYKKIFKAGYFYTTNNRMELMAVILPLQYLLYVNNILFINIFTDSNYLFAGITNWICVWKNNNWKSTHNKKIKNIDLWFRLYNISVIFKKKIYWHLIKAHSGHYENEKCDKIAFGEALNPSLIDLPSS